jgi:hypothetical protein
MRLPQKLNAIEQEHLQELYDATGIARDLLPYTPEYDKLCEDFQFRAFKNADQEQIYGALLRYVRSSTVPSGEVPPVTLTPDQLKLLKEVLRRTASKGGKVLPYSSEFESAMKEFNTLAKIELAPRDFWLALTQSQGKSRRPPRRPAKATKVEADDEEEGAE